MIKLKINYGYIFGLIQPLFHFSESEEGKFDWPQGKPGYDS